MDDVSISAPEVILPSESPKSTSEAKIDYIERAKLILARYKEGILIKDIAIEFNVSEGRISQIVKKNEDKLAIDREAEKTRRVRRLMIAEKKGSLAIAPKDSDQLVRLIDAQRKELEGDSHSSGNTTNIQINTVVTDGKSASELWEVARKLIDGT